MTWPRPVNSSVLLDGLEERPKPDHGQQEALLIFIRTGCLDGYFEFLVVDRTFICSDLKVTNDQIRPDIMLSAVLKTTFLTYLATCPLFQSFLQDEGSQPPATFSLTRFNDSSAHEATVHHHQTDADYTERNKQQHKPGMDCSLDSKLIHVHSRSDQVIGGLISNGISGKLEGISALVTGGNTGTGRSVAILLALEGARVAITYLDTEEEDAYRTKLQVERTGGELLLVPIDSTRAINSKNVAERSAKILGKIDIFYNRFALMRGQGDAWDLTE